MRTSDTRREGIPALRPGAPGWRSLAGILRRAVHGGKGLPTYRHAVGRQSLADSWPGRVAIFLTMAMICAAPGEAADKASREREMLRRVQQQMRQVEQQKAQLEQEFAEEKAKLAGDAEKARKQLGGATRKLKAAEKKLAETEGERDVARRENLALLEKSQTLEKRLAETADSLRETSGRLARTESEKKRAEANLARTGQSLATCETHNGKLYGIGRELMDQYAGKSCADAMAQAEPFTGLKQIEIENLLEQYRDRLDAEKLVGRTSPPGAR